MRWSKKLQRAICLVLCCTAILGSLTACDAQKDIPMTAYPVTAVENKAASITFLDMGMGEATFIEAGSSTVLVDTGNSDSYSTLTTFLHSKRVSTIDCLVITNPQADYCGAAKDLLDDFKVRMILIPKWSAEVVNKYQHYIDFNTKAIQKSIQIKNTSYGFSGKVGQIKLLALGPQSDTYIDMDDYAQIIKVSLGSVTCLLMGSAGADAEQELVSGRYNIQSDIVRTSRLSVKGANSQEFVETVNPTIVVAPGSGKGFKSAKSDAVNQYEKHEAELFQLKDHGTVTLVTDGRVFGLTSEYYLETDTSNRIR